MSKGAGLPKLRGQGSFPKSSLFQFANTALYTSALDHSELPIKACPRSHTHRVPWSHFLGTKKTLGSSLPSQGQGGGREEKNPSSWSTEQSVLSPRPRIHMLVALGAYGLPAQSRNTGEHNGFHMGPDAVKTLRRVQIPPKTASVFGIVPIVLVKFGCLF